MRPSIYFFAAIFLLKTGLTVPVYTDTTYPVITVTDTAEYYKVTINDLEGDSLFDIAYAWGTKPHVYAYVSVASDDTANWVFSHAESLRWEYIRQKVVERWDKATYNKHPLEFTFLKNPLIMDQDKETILNTDIGYLRMYSFKKIKDENVISLKTPYIYIYASMEGTILMMWDKVQMEMETRIFLQYI